jgi:hypothetical protein
MRSAAKFVLVAVSFVVGPVVFSLPGWAQQQVVHVPATGDPNYSFSKTESSQDAPSGYEGRTNNSTRTSAGRSPATDGRVFVQKISLGNEIKNCPQADGTAEGDGLFTASVEYNDKQGNRGHIAMTARAKYKGQVGDNALLEGPVKADVDYTYSVSGRFPDQNGLIFSPAPVNAQQHVTTDVGVVPGLDPPTLSNFKASNLEQGNFSSAFGAAIAVAYWGGVYYAIAEYKWIHDGICVSVVFDPPSYTQQPAPGTQVKVKAQVKTMTGEVTKANYVKVSPYLGTVVPLSGGSDVGTPLTFTYTAPSKKPAGPNAQLGFAVEVTSRAGATGTKSVPWLADLGTDWSGQITYTSTYTGDQGQNDLQSWSSSNATFFTVAVKDGAATADGNSEETYIRINLHKVAQDGKVVLQPDNSDTTHGTASGEKHGKVSVEMDTSKKTYSIKLDVGVLPPGHAQTVSCMRDKGCDTTETPFYVVPDFNRLAGSFDDPNHVHGSRTDVTHELGRGRNGTRTDTLTWDLARKGTTN